MSGGTEEQNDEKNGKRAVIEWADDARGIEREGTGLTPGEKANVESEIGPRQTWIKKDKAQ